MGTAASSPGHERGGSAPIVGLTLVQKILEAAFARADVPREERRPSPHYPQAPQRLADHTKAGIIESQKLPRGTFSP